MLHNPMGLRVVDAMRAAGKQVRLPLQDMGQGRAVVAESRRGHIQWLFLSSRLSHLESRRPIGRESLSLSVTLCGFDMAREAQTRVTRCCSDIEARQCGGVGPEERDEEHTWLNPGECREGLCWTMRVRTLDLPATVTLEARRRPSAARSSSSSRRSHCSTTLHVDRCVDYLTMHMLVWKRSSTASKKNFMFSILPNRSKTRFDREVSFM
jgi:hypothetical protein